MMLAVMLPGMEWIFIIIGVCILLLFVSGAIGLFLVIKSATVRSNQEPRNNSRQFWSLCFGLLLLLPPMFCFLTPPLLLPASNAKTCAKVKSGMTAEAVRTVLGSPGQSVSYEDGSGHW